MELTLETFLIICPLVFLAGLIDSIAGGGGLISLPAYLMAGLSPHNAIATNKLSSALGSTVATVRYIKNKCVNVKLIAPTVILALIGSAIGAQLVLRIDEKYVKYLLIIVLPIIAILVLRKKEVIDVTEEIPFKRQLMIASIAAFVIGVYDGFYGPGTGTFLILILTGGAKMNVRIASGNTKCINLASNYAALVTFLLRGKVVIILGLTAALFGIVGNYVGAGMVVKNGTKIVKPIILVVMILLFIKSIIS